MSDYSSKEEMCQMAFSNIGPCYHIWTPENFEIIFRNDSEFRIGMGIIAIVSMCFRGIKIITFELMTNHLHIMAAGDELELRRMFDLITKYLRRMSNDCGRTINWAMFKPGIRRLNDLADARNVLVYDNRNGFLVHDNYTPFSYPWGSNFCYFNPDARKRYEESSVFSTIKSRRLISHSHISDELHGLKILDQCFSPFSFCDIDAGEKLFRDAVHYFHLLGRNIEQNVAIAREIGENISYTDSELYSAISLKCREKWSVSYPSQIPSEAKIEMAKFMHFEYNATEKQIVRILRLEPNILHSVLGCRR